MPLYEYECEACGHRFEVIQKFSDSPIEKCPKCGSAVRKLQSAPAFQFKGTGWYITDYARKDQGAGGPKSDSKESSGGKEGAASTDKTESAKTEKTATTTDSSDKSNKSDKGDKGDKSAASTTKTSSS